MINKIEQFAELSFSQDMKQHNKAALQTCFFNLQNMKQLIRPDAKNNQNEQKMHGDNQKIITNRVSQSSFMRKDWRHRDVNEWLRRTYMTINQANTNSDTQIDIKKFKQIAQRQLQKQCANKQKQVNKQNKQNKRIKQKNFFCIRKKYSPKQAILTKDQKYFENTEVKVTEQVVQKLGLYEAVNLFKQKNIKAFLKNGYENKFKPVINLKFATFALCDRNQFFLTDKQYAQQIYEMQSNIEPPKRKKQFCDTKQQTQNMQYQKINKNSIIKSQTSCIDEESPPLEKQNQMLEIKQFTVMIKNYQIIKDEQYYVFKKNCIEDWNQINFILKQICSYLKKVKIMLLSFKFQKQAFLSQLSSIHRIRQSTLQKLLKIKLTVKNSEKQKGKTIRLYSTRAEIIKQLLNMWRDRQKLQKMKKEKQRYHERLTWSLIRMFAKRKILTAKKKRISRVQLLNEKLRNGDWDYQLEIHIPSFSQSQFVRNTTQYMQHYQNLFYHMWKSSTKQFVLVIPAINQSLLSMFQQKIKLSKNITLICPQSHELYPKSLPLSACLLYSKQALSKVKKLLQNKKGIIIPGRKVSSKYLYEEHLSDLLNCPLFCKLNVSNYIGDNKQLWQKYQISTAVHTIILPHSTLNEIIQKLSQLICSNPKARVWIFKINTEFNGRGIAKFDAQSSRKLKQILALSQTTHIRQNNSQIQISQPKVGSKIKQQIKQLVIEYLNTHFRLKLKVNFQNCIFRVEEYIQMLITKGGVIQQFLDECDTYQLCFKIQPGYTNYSHLYILDQLEQEKHICCCQNYQVDFVTKSSIFLSEDYPKAIKTFSKKVQKILKLQKYLGYVSVTVLYSASKQQYYAVEIKSYMTINSSMSYMIKMFSSKKSSNAMTNRRNGNLISSNQLISKADLSGAQNSGSNGLIFMFVPYILFTDVDQIARSQLIQNLVLQSWENISTKLFTHSIVTDNKESFHGTLYVSLGLTLGILFYGKSFELRKIKSQAVECIRQLSDKIHSIRLYRGRQETRDFFQFGDLIRAITKIKF